jgi:hypothetical protein
MTQDNRVITDARHCAALFRLGRDVEAALKMVDLIETVVPWSASQTVVQQQALQKVLGEILACQERQDWIGVADWLGYELVELLQGV